MFAFCGEGIARDEISVPDTWGRNGALLVKELKGEEFDATVKPDGSIQINPAETMKTITISCAMMYGVLPNRFAEDFVYDPNNYPDAHEAYVPVANVFMGLLEGKDRILVCAWPEGGQKVKLLLSNNDKGEPIIHAIEIQPDNKSFYLGILAAPGIWHKLITDDSYFGKDVKLGWKKPFSAIWKTQLFENEDVKTSYPFKDKMRMENIVRFPNGSSKYLAEGRGHRASIGYYPWPVWFEGDKAFIHLSKKIPPTGRILIYALEGNENTAKGFVKRNVGEVPSLTRPIGLTWPPRPTGVFACNGRDCVERIFRAGWQVRESRFLQEVFDDFDAENEVLGNRILEYHKFIEKMKTKIDSWQVTEKDNPQTLNYLETMKEGINEVERKYLRIMGERLAPELVAYEAKGIARLRELSKETGHEHYAEVKHLLLDTNGTTDRIETVTSIIGGQALKEWCRQVALQCATRPQGVKYAAIIRREVTEFLRHDESWEAIY
jgi:hypothetical protein